MADEAEEELVAVETPPEDKQPAAIDEDPKSTDTSDEGDDDDGDEDERIAGADEDDSGDDNVNRRRRRQRREAQRRARERNEDAINRLIEENRALQERVAAVEGHSVQTTVLSLDERIAKATADARQATEIEAAAITAGNGEDATLARNIAMAAKAEADRLAAHKEQLLANQKDAQNPNLPMRDEWLRANPWFRADSGDRHSMLAKAIDNEVAREGFDPRSREYWVEVSRRCGDAFAKIDGSQKAEEPQKRAKNTDNGPPMGGNGGEHASTRTRSNEIYVTPERKAAMEAAGVWEDPVARQRFLKAYRDYDTNAAR